MATASIFFPVKSDSLRRSRIDKDKVLECAFVSVLSFNAISFPLLHKATEQT
jgi:hypothetical protein